MKRFLLVLVVSLSLLSSGRSEVQIAPANCILNQGEGYCLWAAIETVGRHQRVRALHGLVEMRKRLRNGQPPRSGDDDAAAAASQLDALGVKYEIQQPLYHSTVLMEWAVRKNLGCVVGFHHPEKGDHAVVVVDYGRTHVRLIDSNRPEAVTVITRAIFDGLWDGFVLVIEGENREGIRQRGAGPVGRTGR